MDHRRQHFSKFLKNRLLYIINPKNLAKVFYRPQRIGTFFSENYTAVKNILTDVKLEAPSAEQLLGVEKASVVALSQLADNSDTSPFLQQTIREVFGEQVDQHEDSVKLGELFRQYGSDKSSTHDYYLVYASLLKDKKNKPIHILEIGMGTNNIDIPSNMGNAGSPGASLRTFRDMYTQAEIYGADIDTRILFEEERIKTFFVDQTRPEVLQQLKQQLSGMEFDLIIDDGLHNTQANLNTMNFALSMLKPGGVFVVEDAGADDLYYYKIVARLLKGRFTLHFLKTRSAYMCVFKQV